MPDSTLNRLRALELPQEYVFRSRLAIIGPLIAAVRTFWNGVSARWYVLDLVRQQSEFNGLVVHELAACEQRLAELSDHLADLAVRLQGYGAGLESQAARVDNLQGLMRDHELWLVQQDREKTYLVHDLAELSMRLVQTNHALGGLCQRLALPGMTDPSSQDAV